MITDYKERLEIIDRVIAKARNNRDKESLKRLIKRRNGVVIGEVARMNKVKKEIGVLN